MVVIPLPRPHLHLLRPAVAQAGGCGILAYGVGCVD